MILESAKRMGNLIDDLLAFSRIGRAETKKTEVNLEQLVKEVVAEMGQETKGRESNGESARFRSVTETVPC